MSVSFNKKRRISLNFISLKGSCLKPQFILKTYNIFHYIVHAVLNRKLFQVQIKMSGSKMVLPVTDVLEFHIIM